MTPTRIAMWSGPRNVSTAMMRAWGNRAGCHVVDEPFYAYYLHRTGLDHPGRAEILRSLPTDWRVVAAELGAGPLPPGKSMGGLAPVVRIDGRPIGAGTTGPVTERLSSAYAKLTAAEGTTVQC